MKINAEKLATTTFFYSVPKRRIQKARSKSRNFQRLVAHRIRGNTASILLWKDLGLKTFPSSTKCSRS